MIRDHEAPQGASADPLAPIARDLSGFVAVVTGGNRGIGLGIARVLGLAGAAVCLWGRDAQQTEDALATLAGDGISAHGFQCDVTNETDVVRKAAEVTDMMGRLDIMVANAGGGARMPLLDTSLEQWDQVVRTNLTSAFLCFREGARQMVRIGEGGSLVAVSSIAAIHAAPTMHHYAAAKAGLCALVRSVAVEMAPFGIRANAVLPGFTDNQKNSQGPQAATLFEETAVSIPAGRWGTPEDVGLAVLYLGDPRMPYHTGADLVVDGGYSKMPPYLAVRFAAGRSGY
jgi:NAD(P)-dependent dehydrogenase (short-subunit alcohol dehydrogenase family)